MRFTNRFPGKVTLSAVAQDFRFGEVDSLLVCPVERLIHVAAVTAATAWQTQPKALLARGDRKVTFVCRPPTSRLVPALCGHEAVKHSASASQISRTNAANPVAH
jgi:hypothetical protein